jgi:hypothetical protein
VYTPPLRQTRDVLGSSPSSGSLYVKFSQSQPLKTVLRTALFYQVHATPLARRLSPSYPINTYLTINVDILDFNVQLPRAVLSIQ